MFIFVAEQRAAMAELESLILDFARSREVFTAQEFASGAPEGASINRLTLEWYLGQLTKEGKLGRVAKGKYTIHPRPVFHITEEETDKALHDRLSAWYPGATFCIYKGTVLATLQHHLSYNALTYIETQRELTEALFHRLQEEGSRIYHRPDKKVFYDYIDISQSGIIIKPLFTGSPLQQTSGVPVPMLEKLLVDIRCDADFDYLGGAESVRMLENATSLYTINTTKLLRYAGRRHCREDFERNLTQLGL